ncbi:hypothetical protein SCHPADRAFT_893024 [Schizopora paradoxa]|uniref:Uncharacterized protein n=1 Tax=Schizopora paradoxa TaxID=27342 RepID=A0A0H2RXS6_9AGAM|nr:hypothetical protein SCHPADRAFT_893024 [Schizopora paradoxa]
MSLGATWTAYAYVAGKRNHFQFSEKQKRKLIEEDPDRRKTGPLGDLYVCDGCGKEKPLIIYPGGKKQVALKVWISHKLRCPKLQKLLEEEYREQGSPEHERQDTGETKSVFPKANNRTTIRRRNPRKRVTTARKSVSRDSSQEPEPRAKRILRSGQRKKIQSGADVQSAGPAEGRTADAPAEPAASKSQPEPSTLHRSTVSSGSSGTSSLKRPFDQVEKGAEIPEVEIVIKRRIAPDGSREQEIRIPRSYLPGSEAYNLATRELKRESRKSSGSQSGLAI